LISTNRIRTIYTSIAIGTATFFFLLFLLLCYHRELGPTKPSLGLFLFAVLLGVGTTITGGTLIGSRSPESRRFGTILAIEGFLLTVLALIAWTNLMGPVPLPPG